MSMSVANAREVAQQPLYTGPAPAASDAAANTAAAQSQAKLINQIANRFQGEAASQFRGSFDAAEWRLAFGSRLFYQPESALATALSSPDINTMNTDLARAVTSKHLGGQENSVQLLTSPCRIVDTRFGGGGVLGPSSRQWYAFNTPAIIAAQGGNASGCGTFPDAEFFLVYVTVVPPGAPLSGGANFLSLTHDGGVPSTATMNFYPGINLSDFAAPSCQGCGGGSTGSFFAYASSNTHVVIDLVGVGQPAVPKTLWASVDSAGVIDRCVGCTSTGTSHLGTGTYEIAFTRNITNCGFSATVGTPNVSAANGITGLSPRAGNPNALFVQTFSVAGAAADRPYYAIVHCP